MVVRSSISLLTEKFMDRELTGVEIGVFNGSHAQEILKELNIKKLYLVDPYLYKGFFGKKIDFLDAYDLAKEKLKSYCDRIEFILSSSDEAINSIKEKVDFVYVDGNHRFHYVLHDILIYSRILKSDGLMHGHDYKNMRNPDTTFAIILGSLLLKKKLKHEGMEWWFE